MNKIPFFKNHIKKRLNFNRSTNNPYFLFYIFTGGLILAFIFLLLRLFQLTIVKGNYYQRLSEENRIKELIVEPKRGAILDRKGYVIVKNNPPQLNTLDDRIESPRNYNNDFSIAHIIGYRQKANKDDLKNDNCQNKLKLGDKIGKIGVEKLFDCRLRGHHGKKLIEVNSQGKYKKTLSYLPPKNGQSIRLALDWQLQKKAYQIITTSETTKNKKTAILALNPKTGEVLTLVSTPSFNPQSFENEETTAIQTYLNDPTQPLFNRVTRGVYPPGSTFKPFIALSALEEEKITKKTLFEDTGTIKAGSRTFGNWYFLEYGRTEGEVDLIKAIRRSNDIFFYKTGALLGPKLIKKWALKFGFGKKTKIGLKENEGLLPSPFWKKETLKERWYLGDTYNLAIGQGYLLTTPLQLTQATAVFANNGYLCQPKLLKQEKSANCQKLPINKDYLALIKQGMIEACQPGGTGWPFFNFSINTEASNQQKTAKNTPLQVGCKTGTAQSHAKSSLPHALFTVFAPAENPEILLTVVVEEGGQGSDIAAPVAKEILKEYFERKE